MKWLHRALTLLAVASALSAAGLAVAAWRNRTTPRLLALGSPRLTRLGCAKVTPARVQLVWQGGPNYAPPTDDAVFHVGSATVYSFAIDRPSADAIEALGLAARPDAAATCCGGRFGYASVTDVYLDGFSAAEVWLPTWAAAAVVGMPAAAAFGTRLLRRRPAPGRCRRCGYDLRATPGRCPECGAMPAGGDQAAGTVTATGPPA